MVCGIGIKNCLGKAKYFAILMVRSASLKSLGNTVLPQYLRKTPELNYSLELLTRRIIKLLLSPHIFRNTIFINGPGWLVVMNYSVIISSTHHLSFIFVVQSLLVVVHGRDGVSEEPVLVPIPGLVPRLRSDRHHGLVDGDWLAFRQEL